MTLLVGRQEGHPGCKKTEWWDVGVVISLERGADLHMAQLIPLPLAVSCSIKIQIGFTFLVPAHLGSPGQRAVKRVCVCCCFLMALTKCPSIYLSLNQRLTGVDPSAAAKSARPSPGIAAVQRIIDSQLCSLHFTVSGVEFVPLRFTAY